MSRVKILNCLLWVIIATSLFSLAWLAYVIAIIGPEALRLSPVFWLNLVTYPLYAVMRKQHRRAILTVGLAEVRDELAALTKGLSNAGTDTLAATTNFMLR